MLICLLLILLVNTYAGKLILDFWRWTIGVKVRFEAGVNIKSKNPLLKGMGFRGLEQIRTAVQGFADLCLATRPRDHFLMECKCRDILCLFK